MRLTSLLAAAAMSCGSPPAPAPIVGAATVAAAPDEIVATVSGRPITVDQVKLQAESAQVTARVALAALIDAEVAAAEAERRGLGADHDVVEAAHQAMVRRLLATTFEKEVTPATIPEADLRSAYQRNRLRLDHPDMVQVQHIVARATKTDGPERRAALRRRMDEVASRARDVHDPVAFVALATALSDDSIKLRAEEITTALKGFGYAPAFCAAAFAIPRENTSSPVLETEFGYHVIFLVRRIAAEHHPFEEAVPHLREGMWPDYQRKQFARFVTELRERHQVQLFPERLGEGVR